MKLTSIFRVICRETQKKSSPVRAKKVEVCRNSAVAKSLSPYARSGSRSNFHSIVYAKTAKLSITKNPKKQKTALCASYNSILEKSGYKKTPQQFTNANSPDATPEAETAVVLDITVPQNETGVNHHSMQNAVKNKRRGLSPV